MQACIACARTKTKCDQQVPCGRCRSKGLLCTPRPTRRHSQQVDSLADEPFFDSENISDHDPEGRNPESTITGMGRKLPSQDLSAFSQNEDRSTTRLDAATVSQSGQLSSQISAADEPVGPPVAGIAANRTPSLSANPSSFLSPVSIPPDHLDNGLGRHFGAALLPQLDWQSLTSDAAPPGDPNPLPSLNQNMENVNTFQDPNWRAFDVSQRYVGIETDQSTLNNDLLFYFNAQESAWETRLSGLNSIMGECFQSNRPVASTGSNASNENVGRPQDCAAETLGSDAQTWSPDDMQMPSEIIIAEEELDRWAMGHCTKASNAKTTYPSPEDDPMRQGNRDFTSWSYAVEKYRDSCFEPYERIETVDLTDETREWMLIAVQNFLRAGMESQDAQKLSELLGVPSGATVQSSERFLLLPPKTSLQKYLDIFLTTFEPFTPMIPALSLNPNKLASRGREREATLLLFLMIAFGSMIDPAPRARQFSYELTEICRHSLRKATDSGGVTKRDTLTLHCALIFTCQASFSGRKSHMEIGTAQRHMYLAMMRNAGYFRRPRTQKLHPADDENQLESYWKAWIDQEIMSRLCYSWVIADQEISLFYDTPPILMLSELEGELPADEKLWMAPNAQSWKLAFDKTQRTTDKDSLFSLHELFSLFTEDRLQDFGRNLNLMDLRLLLHPLHSLVSNYCQVTAGLNTRSRSSRNVSSRVRSSSSQPFEEIHILIRRWLLVFETVDIRGARLSAAARATLIQYHLISINLLCPFKRLELFARQENPEIIGEFAFSIQDEANKYSPELLLHCGQILRLVRATDVKLRPPWWSAAIYRATLVLWVNGVTRQYTLRHTGQPYRPAGPTIALDMLPFFDPSLSHYLLHNIGIPSITAEDGIVVPIDRPRAVLQTGIETFGRGQRLWRLTRGFQCKMEALSRNWDEIHQQLEK